jgi:prepilin-type N-terminal cleavage/methylation domain-containing protein
MNTTAAQDRSQAIRYGFTLVELLIVITIMLLLLSITVYSVDFAQETNRVRSGASKVQSYLAGARDRAIYRKSPIGVRMFLDSEGDPNQTANRRHTISSMVYIDPGQTWSDGVIQLQRWDPDHNGRTNFPNSGNPNPDINGDGLRDNPGLIWMVAGSGTGWWELKRRGLLVDGLRIRIPKGRTGTWYPILTSLIDTTVAPQPTQFLLLQIPYADSGDTPVQRSQAFESGGPEDYELELPPSIMPSEAGLLPEDVVVDLDMSLVPLSWRPAATHNAGVYSPYMDIVFSPRGNVIGNAASQGVIHIYVGDKNDSIDLRSAAMAAAPPPNLPTPFVPADEINAAWVQSLTEDGEPYTVNERRVVSIMTQTGDVSVHPVNPYDGPEGSEDGVANDPYFFAETGEEAN